MFIGKSSIRYAVCHPFRQIISIRSICYTACAMNNSSAIGHARCYKQNVNMLVALD